MILASVLLGAVIVGVVATYWNDLVNWLKRAINKVKDVVNNVVYGVKVFIKKIGEGIKEISKHYSKDNIGRWQETIVTKIVSEDEVPKEIREKAERYNEYDITDELQLQLEA